MRNFYLFFLLISFSSIISTKSIDKLKYYGPDILNFHKRVKRGLNPDNVPVVIAVCLTISIAIIIIIIAVVTCLCCRKKIGAALIQTESQEQCPPGTIYYQANQFTHKGALKIQKHAPVQLKATFADEKDDNPTNARFQFTDDKNEVVDIGSEVEQIVD